MTRPDEERLREAFQELRADARSSGPVPDFGLMMAEAKRQAEERPALEVVLGDGAEAGRTPRRRRLWQASAWASAAVAATVAGLVLVDRGPSGDEEFERLVATYSSEVGASLRSPTSALLDVPGMDLTRSLPTIGAPVRGVDPSTLPTAVPSPEEENL